MVWISDDKPGIRRERVGDRSRDRGLDGPIRKAAAELRTNRPAIPPAYERVWICPRPNGHLQATGRDARSTATTPTGAWRRDAESSSRSFGAALPRIEACGPTWRRRSRRCAATRDGAGDAGRRHHPGRVGTTNTRENRSFGLTTLRNRHADVKAAASASGFAARAASSTRSTSTRPASSGVARRCPARSCSSTKTKTDRRRRRRLGRRQRLHTRGGRRRFTAKDFRTWHGSVHTLSLWRARPTRAAGAAPTSGPRWRSASTRWRCAGSRTSTPVC